LRLCPTPRWESSQHSHSWILGRNGKGMGEEERGNERRVKEVTRPGLRIINPGYANGWRSFKLYE